MMSQIASGILAWPTTTIELGHATDTTLSRGAAGFMAVEGKRVPAPASQAAGDLLYRGSTEWERLAKGTALQVLRQNAALTAPEWATAREVLTGARTYYVRTDGSDSNTGLVDSAGGAYLTIQKAINVVYGTLDLGGFAVTIDVGNGTYTGAVSVTSPQVGAGTITIFGDTTTPSNVVISVTSNTAVRVTGFGSVLNLSGVKIVTTTSGSGIYVSSGGVVNITGKCDFGTCVSNQMVTDSQGVINCISVNYDITGGATCHMNSSQGGQIILFGNTVTLTGTPAFSVQFARGTGTAFMAALSITYSGSATGTRYSATTNAVIDTGGGGASYFPGNAAGSTATGGQYA
jgi:hypothetical protein